MKRFIVYCLLLTVGVFFLGGCNSPDDTPLGPGGPLVGEDVVFDWGSGMKTEKFEGSENDKWIGKSFPLTGATGSGPVGNINLYSSIIIEADLYDTSDAIISEAIPDLAQFSLLKVNSDWESNKLASGSNMKTGSTSGVPLSGKTDAPEHLLLEVHYWTSLPAGVTKQVGYINVRKLTFVPKTSNIVLDVVYDKGSFITVTGNRISFNNAMYSDAAAIYNFPTAWGEGSSLSGKTITFTYSIPAHTCVPAGSPPNGATIEHQIHVQAANSNKNDFNGKDGANGQLYKELELAGGTFTATGLELYNASQSSAETGTDFPKKFDVNAVRIANNGTAWTNESDNVTHYRCKTYMLVIDDITIAP